MNAVRIVKRLESETLHLPELRPLLGKDVEIIVLDQSADPLESDEFWQNRSIEELEAMQGLSGPTDLNRIFGGWPEDQLDDGFERVLEQWRAPESDGPGK
jgi:hypothetical protein